MACAFCGAHAEEAQAVISTAEDLFALFDEQSGKFTATNVVMNGDISFTSVSLENLPLGTLADGSCVPFSGLFDGKGHAITSLVLDRSADEKEASLFCALNNATVQNVLFSSSCRFKGSSASSLASKVSGGTNLISNVTNNAAVTCDAPTGVYSTQSCSGIVGTVTYFGTNLVVPLRFTREFLKIPPPIVAAISDILGHNYEIWTQTFE